MCYYPPVVGMTLNDTHGTICVGKSNVTVVQNIRNVYTNIFLGAQCTQITASELKNYFGRAPISLFDHTHNLWILLLWRELPVLEVTKYHNIRKKHRLCVRPVLAIGALYKKEEILKNDTIIPSMQCFSNTCSFATILYFAVCIVCCCVSDTKGSYKCGDCADGYQLMQPNQRGTCCKVAKVEAGTDSHHRKLQFYQSYNVTPCGHFHQLSPTIRNFDFISHASWSHLENLNELSYWSLTYTCIVMYEVQCKICPLFSRYSIQMMTIVPINP